MGYRGAEGEGVGLIAQALGNGDQLVNAGSCWLGLPGPFPCQDPGQRLAFPPVSRLRDRPTRAQGAAQPRKAQPVSSWQIKTFAELLAHLDGLVEAAWTAGVDPRLARQLAAVRQRLVRIQGHLEGQANPGHPPPTPRHKILHTNHDLLTQFGEVVDAARAGGTLAMSLSHYLHNTRQRLTFFLRSREHRLSSRQVPETGAAAVLAVDGRQQEVTVMDRSPFGVGLLADAPVDTDQMAQLSCPDHPGGTKTYQCLTVHCRRHRDGYRVGLEIITAKLS